MKMTRKIALIVAIISLGSVSCREQFEVVDDVNFDVTTKAVTFKVGEPVRFTFSGNTDFITFYSGEKGHDYAFKNKDRITEGSMVFSFLTNTGAGTSGFPNPSVVPISYSTDFSGEYTEEAVRAATWIDITDHRMTKLLYGSVSIIKLPSMMQRQPTAKGMAVRNGFLFLHLSKGSLRVFQRKFMILQHLIGR